MAETKHPMTDPEACKELKEKHDVCFYKWYSEKFLKGTITIDCKEEWDEYEFCLTQKLKAWKLDHLKPPPPTLPPPPSKVPNLISPPTN